MSPALALVYRARWVFRYGSGARLTYRMGLQTAPLTPLDRLFVEYRNGRAAVNVALMWTASVGFPSAELGTDSETPQRSHCLAAAVLACPAPRLLAGDGSALRPTELVQLLLAECPVIHIFDTDPRGRAVYGTRAARCCICAKEAAMNPADWFDLMDEKQDVVTEQVRQQLPDVEFSTMKVGLPPVIYLQHGHGKGADTANPAKLDLDEGGNVAGVELLTPPS